MWTKDDGARIQGERRRLGLSQGGLAAMFHQERGTVARIESGKQTPRANELVVMARVFNRSVDWLLGAEPQDVYPDTTTPAPGPSVGEAVTAYEAAAVDLPLFREVVGIVCDDAARDGKSYRMDDLLAACRWGYKFIQIEQKKDRANRA